MITKDHGSCVVQSKPSGNAAPEPADNVPTASGTSSSSRTPRIIADFQVCDLDGNVEIRQDHDGRVFIPGRHSHIGGYNMISENT